MLRLNGRALVVATIHTLIGSSALAQSTAPETIVPPDAYSSQAPSGSVAIAAPESSGSTPAIADPAPPATPSQERAATPASAVSATAVTSRRTDVRNPTIQLSAGVDLAFEHVFFQPAMLLRDSAQGAVTVGGAVYSRPVVDDEASPGLQPFLQRVSTYSFGLSTGGSHVSVGPAVEVGVLHIDSTRIDASIGVDQYVGRHVALWGAAGVAYQYAWAEEQVSAVFQLPLSSHDIPLAAGIGVRFGDTRIDAGYAITFRGRSRFDGDRMGFTPESWGFDYLYGVTLSVTSVIAQRVRLQADARLIEDGARGGLAIAVFPIRMLELRAGAALAHGRFGVDGGVHDRGSGSLGSTYWFAQRFGASVDYEVSVVDDSLFVLGNAMSVRMIGRY